LVPVSALGWVPVAPSALPQKEGEAVQYRGRLDASRTTLVANARRDLFEAMKQVAETGHGPGDQVPSMGCSIRWKD
jgi:hypothetical protein